MKLLFKTFQNYIYIHANSLSGGSMLTLFIIFQQLTNSGRSSEACLPVLVVNEFTFVG